MNFELGTFHPAPQRASALQMAVAQGRVEAKLMLRHGEQLLLSIVIPAALLISANYTQVFGSDFSFNELVPMVFAVATTSAGFTGQAISLAFDRRYGALKRTGASGVPAWTIVVGKILGVLAMVAVQVVLLGALALVLGWSPPVGGVVIALAILTLGVATFTALGLLMGGTMSSELVLALANLIWVILMGVVGWVAYSGNIAEAGWWNVVPTVALAGGLSDALAFSFNLPAIVSLTLWLLAGISASVRWFRFDG